MMKCTFCKKQVRNGTTHHCDEMRRAGHQEQEVSDDGSFFLSAVVGAVTDSAIIGGLVGGSFTGSLVGDALDGDVFDD
jgi:hypothetical protein